MKEKIKKVVLNKIKEQKSENLKSSLGTKILMGFLIFTFTCFISGILFIFYLLQGLPTMDELKDVQTKESTQILDRNGKVLYTIYGDENRKVVPFEKIQNQTIYAIMSLEDENFFNHGGVDYKGLARAVLGQLGLINFDGGGSTITQQFVKNKYLSSERTYIRKLKEMILSMQLENTHTKEEIITMYLNQIPFGSNIYGIEQASKKFFGKDSSELNLAESVIIASIPNATTRYSPYGNHIRSNYIGETDKISIGLLPNKIEKKVIKNNAGTGSLSGTGAEIEYDFLGGRTTLALDKMLELGYISEEEKNKGVEDLLKYKFKQNVEKIKAPHFVMLVKEKLEKEFGEEILKKGGMKIFTTLDLDLQEKAEELVAKSAKYNKTTFDAENQSLLSVDTKKGEILAMVGSRNYFDDEIDGQVNIMTSKRLAGSTFKPFAYTSMLLNGYSPYSIIFDTKTNFGEEGHDYEPQNFDGKFMGPMSLGKALGQSRNIPAIKAGLIGGIEKTYNIAKSMGIKFENAYDWYGASLPLGTVGVKGIDLLSAYMIFANNGEQIEIKSISKIIDQNGVILKKFKNTPASDEDKKIVLNPEIAFQITKMLSDSSNRGAGWNSRLQLKGRENIVKTGTSNKSVEKEGYRNPIVMPLDGWTIGLTSQYSTIVWSGNNDGRIMNKKGSGRSASAKTWKDFMEYLHKGKPVENFKKPDGVKLVRIATLSGLLPSKNTPKNLIQTGYFSSLNIPKSYDNSLSFVEIDKVSKKLPTNFTPEEAISKAAVLNLHSLKRYDPRWENSVKEWMKDNGDEFLKDYGFKNILADFPTEMDDIHTRENTLFGPKVSISSPKNNGIVGKSGFSVVPEISSKNGVSRVDYYLNGKLNNSVFNFPYIGNIKLDENIAISSKLSLKIKVFDELYNSSEKEISLKIGEDDKKPYTEIVRPLAGQELVAGSTFDIKTLTYDQGGQIEEAIFYLDGKEVSKIFNAPFSTKIEIPRLVGEHKIKIIAIDTAGNSQFDEKNINVVRLKNSSTEIGLNLPKDFFANSPFDFSISMPYSEIKNYEKVEIYAKTRGVSGKEQDILVGTIDDFSGNSTGFFYLNGILDKGNYLIYLKKFYSINIDNNGNNFSKKELEDGKNIKNGDGIAINVK